MDRMEMSEIEKTTCDFYSCFCGTDISDAKRGVKLVCSEERDRVLKGYGCKYTIFILLRGDKCIAAYSPRYSSFFEGFDEDTDIPELIVSADRRFHLKSRQLMVFREERVTDHKNAVMLTPTDYPLYETFFKKAHPSVSDIDWLGEYFKEKSEKELMFGYEADGELVSVCDAPDMPYMEGHIQHTGIMTLPEYRRKGYAKCCTALAAYHHIGRALVPQWDCTSDNTASVELARSIGYDDFARAFILEE